MIELHEVGRLAGGRTLLRGVSMRVQPGRIVALIGPNGAGKSTLLRIASGEVKPDTGMVSLDGQSLGVWSRGDLARRRAVLPQATALAFPLSAAEVVALGASPWDRGAGPVETTMRVRRAMARSGVLALAQQAYSTLSGGERQLVQLARALLQLDAPDASPTRYLILDEPTSALDLAHQARFRGLVRGLAADGLGILAVLHDLQLAADIADDLIALRSGSVLAAGSVAEVVRAEVLGDLYGTAIDVHQLGGGRLMVAPRAA